MSLGSLPRGYFYMTYASEVTTDAPRARFQFDGSTANTGPTGTVTGAPSAYVAGIGTGAAEFTGAQTVYASSGTTNAFGNQTTAITMECWVKTEDTVGGTILRVAPGTAQSAYSYSLAMLADGRVSFRFRGTSGDQSATSTAAINDGQWHHIAGVGTFNQVRVFVDGAKDTATATNYGGGITTPKFYVGSFGASEYFNGVIDEAAVYNKELTDARIVAHYNAGVPELPAPGVDAVNDVLAATMSLTTSDVTVESVENLTMLTPAKDKAAFDTGSPGTILAAGWDSTINARGGMRSALQFDVSALPNGTYSNVELMVYLSDTRGSYNLRVYNASGAWTEADTNFPTQGTLVATKAISNGQIGWVSIPLPDAKPGGHYYLNGDKGPNDGNNYSIITSREGGSNGPKLAYLYTAPAVSVNVDLDKPTATLSAPDVTTEYSHDSAVEVAQATVYASEASVETGAVVVLDAAGINAQAHEATAEAYVTPDAMVDVDAAVVTFDAPQAEGSIPTSVDLALADGVTATANDATVEVRYNAINDLDAPRINVTHKQLESVNGEPIVYSEEDDPYFNAVMLSDPTIWYRFNDPTNPVQPRVGTGAVDIVNGVPGLNGGIGERKYVYFNGTAYFAQPNQGIETDENYSRNGTLTFALRTSKENQFLMRMDDRFLPEGGTFSQRLGAYDLWLANGKVELRRGTEVVFTSFANIADGDWHHIVLTGEDDRDADAYSVSRINLYIDGELDIRRYKTAGVSFPDYIGGMPSLTDQTKWFVGDMTEVAVFKNNYFRQDVVYRHYDTLIGRDPVYVESAKIQTKTQDAIVKGNKPRVLVLDFGWTNTVRYSGGAPIENDDYTNEFGGTNVDFNGFGKWRLRSEWDRNDVRQKVGPYNPADIGGMLVYTVSVGPTTMAGQNWTDERLDTPRLVDLEKDLNMDDYDIISIADYPQSSDTAVENPNDYGVEFGGMTFIQMRERLMEQVRKQAVAGKGLFINDPRSAIELGIIDRVEYVPEYREGISLDNRVGAVTGLYDAFGGVGKRGPASTDVARNARYNDQHANMFQRVRNLVPGLTDVKGYWIHTDSSLWRNVDPLDPPNSVFKYRHEDRTETGLLLDDEFYLTGGNGLDQRSIYGRQVGFALDSDYRVNGWVGTPLSAIKTGVAVTTFGSKVGMKDEMVDNPYKDHAVTIAVRPGDTLKGETIAGRVYVNFTEAYNKYAHIVEAQPREIIPENRTSADGRVVVPEEDLYWTYAETRGDWTGDTIIFNSPIDTSNWDTLNEGEKAGSGKNVRTWKWAMQNYRSAFPVETILVAPMARRGLDWLIGEIEEDGNATAGAQAAKVTTAANDVTVETTQSADVTVGAARVSVDVQPMPDVTEADATVLVGSPTLTVRAQEFMEIVDLDAASITLNAPDVENDLLNSVDRIWVTMPVHNITLILEEE